MEYIEFDNVEIITQTKDAVLVKFKVKEEELWVPWSVVEDNDENFKNGYKGSMYICEWFAMKEGLH